jgi:hypothetical protein
MWCDVQWVWPVDFTERLSAAGDYNEAISTFGEALEHFQPTETGAPDIVSRDLSVHTESLGLTAGDGGRVGAGKKLPTDTQAPNEEPIGQGFQDFLDPWKVAGLEAGLRRAEQLAARKEQIELERQE